MAARAMATSTKRARVRVARGMAMATKKARARAARGMSTARRVVGNKRAMASGNKEGNGNQRQHHGQ
jgi:hypothetical protein